jgi:hypothetical protein
VTKRLFDKLWTEGEASPTEQALAAKDEALMECYRALKELTEALSYDPGRKQAAAIIAEYYGDNSPAGLGTADAVILRGLQAVSGFDRACNDFLGTLKPA